MLNRKIFKKLFSIVSVFALFLSTACGGNNAQSNSVSESAVECSHECSEWYSEEYVHYQECVLCGDVYNIARHNGGKATCQSGAPCEICGYVYTKLGSHICGDGMVDIDGEKFFQCSICSENISLKDMVDFTVEISGGKTPVVLQISDPQIIPQASGWGLYKTQTAEENCYKYIRKTVQEIRPDLILVTGDLVYGSFDSDGKALIEYIDFMESLKTPWAPVFGNHDNESEKGVNWQCEQLENAEYCLFEQNTVTGNGNYSVGLVQNNKLLRVFYMLDSNGCTDASDSSLSSAHFRKSSGFGEDQIEWYTQSAKLIKQVTSETKITFSYHIQQAIFATAYAQYGFKQTTIEENPINIDTLETKNEGDFGYLGRGLKGAWDTDNKVYNTMKSLGADSIMVGHEHCNSASVVYDGIRFQFGQKCSIYDRLNWLNADGSIVGATGGSSRGNSTPILGGSVWELASDGAIQRAYLHLVTF